MLTPVPGSSTISGMNGQDVITAVRDLLNEAEVGFWNDTQMLKWINAGIVDIVGKTWCIGTSESITLATDTVEYTLTNSTITTVAVVYNSAKGLVIGHPSMLGHVHDVAEPVYYYIFNNKCGIIPKPAAAIAGNTCEVYQIPMPTAITVSGSVVLPSYLDDCLQYYVMWKAFLKDDRPEEAVGMENKYGKDIVAFRSDLLQQKMSEYETKAKN